MIRFLGIVIATEKEIDIVQTISHVNKTHLESARKRITVLEELAHEFPYLQLQRKLVNAEAELLRTKDELAGCKKILEEKRQAELDRFKKEK